MTQLPTWPPAPAHPQLDTDEVHVWRAPLDISRDELMRSKALLLPDECIRANAARSARGRQHFIVARATTRRILSRYLGLTPSKITLETTAQGKPFVAPAQNALAVHFNVSHSGDVVLLAMARARQVGVDVEKVRQNVPVERVAGRYFAPSEVDALLALPANERRAGFFSGWTRKEAYCKARGGGLSAGLGSFEVSMSPRVAQPHQLRQSGLGDAEIARWSLLDLDVGENYFAALAVETHGEPVALRQWEIGDAVGK